jgi:hypothetical protein
LQRPYYFLQQAAQRIRGLSVVPEIEVFDTAMGENGHRLMQED